MNTRQERTISIFQGVLSLMPKIMIEPQPPLFLQKGTELQDCITRLQQLHTEPQRAYVKGGG